MRRPIIYFLLDENGQSYWNDAEGNLISLPSPQPLPDSPDGWADLSLQLERNENYYGIFRNYSLPFGFQLFGRRLLQQLVHQTRGVEAKAYISLAQYKPQTMRYEPFFLSTLNFSTFTDGEDIAEIQATEGDLVALIKANEGTTYEIPVDVPESINVQFDGIILYSVVNVINYAALVPDGAGGQVPNTIFSRYNFFGISITDTETRYPSLLWATTTTYRGAESLDFDPNDWLMQASATVTARFQATDFTILLAGSFFYRVGLYIRDLAGNARQVDLYPPTPPGPGLQQVFSFDATVVINEGERVWMFLENNGGAGKSVSFPVDNRINITYDYRKESTAVQCLRGSYVFQQLINKITDGQYTASSNILSSGGIFYDIVLTCGDALRGFRNGIPVDYEGPRIKTSLRDFFQSYNAISPIGMGVEDLIARIEGREYFYQNTTIVDVGGVDEFKYSPATGHIFNVVKVGYPNQTYEDINGRSEFNTTQSYTTPIKSVTKEYDVTSKYRGDPYGMEFTRINLENRTTTDDSSDSDVFMVNIAQLGGQYILYRPNFTSITGVPAGTSIFNTQISPKHCLRNHGPYLRAGLDKQDDKSLIFQSTDKNRQLVTILDGITTTEQADQPISELGTKMFLPWVFEFRCATPINFVDLMNANPFGKVQFWWKGYSYRGFLIQVAQQPVQNGSQVFRLLASTDNDMNTLIKAVNG